MKDRNILARISAVLFTSLFSSIAFADTDFIDWQDQYAKDTNGDPIPVPTKFYYPEFVDTIGGATVTVEQNLGFVDEIGPYSIILPSASLPGWSSQIPDTLYFTNTQENNNVFNPITFSNFDGISVCGFSTHIAPVEGGPFTAQIEAFTNSGSQSATTDPSSNTDAAFIGISSTEPMDIVEITMLDTGGSSPSYYAINRVTLTTCDTAPKLICDGFAAPMDIFPVSAKKNRAFPLKMELFSDGGTEQTDLDLIATPVVTVMFTDSDTDEPVNVNEMTLATGHGTEGNQFEFTDDGIWQFNLRSKNYSANGTYLVTVVSGDEDEYVIDPACVTSFMIK